MKLEFKERGAKEFYDEFLYILTKYPKLIRKPKTKVKPISREAFILELISVIFFIAFVILYLIDRDYKPFLYVVILFAMLTVLSFLYRFMIKGRIDKLKNDNGTITVDFGKDTIKYSNGNEKYDVNWEDIKYIIINKYSICFMHKTIKNVLIAISTDYVEDVMKVIKKYEKNDLIVDNRDL